MFVESGKDGKLIFIGARKKKSEGIVHSLLGICVIFLYCFCLYGLGYSCNIYLDMVY